MDETRTHDTSVAVIVTNYNQRRFLADALESLCRQRLAPAEVVVVDDGSQEPVDDIVARYSGFRLWQQSNSGASAARNTGLSLTSAPFVVFLDADDRLLPDALACGLSSLLESPAAGQTAGCAYLIDVDGNPHGEFKAGPSPGRPLYAEMLRKAYACPPSAVMFRRSALEQAGGWSERHSYCEDWELYLRVGRMSAMAYHGAIVAEYRMHPGQTGSDARQLWRAIQALLAEQEQFTTGDRRLERSRRAALRYWTIVCHYRMAVQDLTAARARGAAERRARIRALAWSLPHRAVRVRDRNGVIKLRRELYRRVSSRGRDRHVTVTDVGVVAGE